jgi:hypothetical protein
MDIAKLNARRNWLSFFFFGVFACLGYIFVAQSHGVSPDNLDWVFWAIVACALGYLVFICLLANQLDEKPVHWVLGLVIFPVIGFLYTYPRMLLYISAAKKRVAVEK